MIRKTTKIFKDIFTIFTIVDNNNNNNNNDDDNNNNNNNNNNKFPETRNYWVDV